MRCVLSIVVPALRHALAFARHHLARTWRHAAAHELVARRVELHRGHRPVLAPTGGTHGNSRLSLLLRCCALLGLSLPFAPYM